MLAVIQDGSKKIETFLSSYFYEWLLLLRIIAKEYSEIYSKDETNKTG